MTTEITLDRAENESFHATNYALPLVRFLALKAFLKLVEALVNYLNRH